MYQSKYARILRFSQLNSVFDHTKCTSNVAVAACYDNDVNEWLYTLCILYSIALIKTIENREA